MTGTQRLERKRYEAETAFLTAYQELYNPLAVGTAFYTADATCSGGMKVTNLGIRPDNDLQWCNVYVAHDGERTIRVHLRGVQDSSRIFLRVNDDDATLITAADIIDECATLRVKLRHGDNTIRLSSGRKPMPDVDYMEIVE